MTDARLELARHGIASVCFHIPKQMLQRFAEAHTGQQDRQDAEKEARTQWMTRAFLAGTKYATIARKVNLSATRVRDLIKVEIARRLRNQEREERMRKLLE